MSVASLRSLALDGILRRFNPFMGTIEGAKRTERFLSDLEGIFLDKSAYGAMLEQKNTLVYTVEAIEPGTDDGDLHYGIGVINPGRVGREYFMTKGHLHAWRDAAELYIGLSGKGVMLLEDEMSGESRMLPLEPGCALYVPGRTGHRTANVGDEPLSYIGVYPARAGHDYGVYATRNFRYSIVEEDGAPKMIRRP